MIFMVCVSCVYSRWWHDLHISLSLTRVRACAHISICTHACKLVNTCVYVHLHLCPVYAIVFHLWAIQEPAKLHFHISGPGKSFHMRSTCIHTICINTQTPVIIVQFYFFHALEICAGCVKVGRVRNTKSTERQKHKETMYNYQLIYCLSKFSAQSNKWLQAWYHLQHS